MGAGAGAGALSTTGGSSRESTPWGREGKEEGRRVGKGEGEKGVRVAAELGTQDGNRSAGPNCRRLQYGVLQALYGGKV